MVARGSRRDVVTFVAALAAFTFTRDTNVLVVAGVAVVALGVALRPAWRARGLVIGVAALAFAFTASALSDAAEPPRWFWPIGETVSIRLLADPGATRVSRRARLPARRRDAWSCRSATSTSSAMS